MNKFLNLLIITLSIFSSQITLSAWQRLPENKTPWAFWALLDQMGGSGYSYANKSIFFLSEFVYQREFKNSTLEIGEYDSLESYYDKLSEIELSKLSPIEKLSLLSNRKLVELETLIKDDMRLFADSWWGNCDGVAAASLLYPEPKKTITMSTVKGKKISLSIADQKAILATYAKHSKSEIFHFTHEANDKGDLTIHQPHHINNILAKQFANNSSALIDISYGPEKWNSAIYAFEKNILDTKKLSSKHVREKIELKIKVAFAGTSTILSSPNLRNSALVFQDHPNFTTEIKVNYILETKNGVQTSEFDPQYPQNKIDYLSIVHPELELKDEYYGEYILDQHFITNLLKAMNP